MCNKSAEKTNDEDFFLSLVRPCVKNLEPYNPGMIPEGSIRLCSNESARGASPAALKAMTEALKAADCLPKQPGSYQGVWPLLLE